MEQSMDPSEEESPDDEFAHALDDAELFPPWKILKCNNPHDCLCILHDFDVAVRKNCTRLFGQGQMELMGGARVLVVLHCSFHEHFSDLKCGLSAIGCDWIKETGCRTYFKVRSIAGREVQCSNL